MAIGVLGSRGGGEGAKNRKKGWGAKAKTGAERKKLRPMSRVLIWPSITYKGHPASTAAPSAPASGEKSLLPAKKTRTTPAIAVSAVHSRAAQSCSPNNLKNAAVAQYCSGGFSKDLKSLRRGVS